MGGSQSTRRVTVVNETNPDIIAVSDEVVQRLNSAPSSPKVFIVVVVVFKRNG